MFVGVTSLVIIDRDVEKGVVGVLASSKKD